jgi:LPS export ABC transporter protein LptC
MRRLALMATAIALIAAAGCKNKGSKPPVRQSSIADSAEQVMFNIHFLLTDKGVERGELFADTAYIFDESTRFDLRKVRSTFNTATGAKDGVMSADRGKYNVRQQLLEGFGNVVIVTNDGKRLTSPRLRYMQGINEVSTDTSFTLVKPGQTLSGIGFKADPQLTHFTILKGGSSRGSLVIPAQ